jgi:hypothetical protein
MQQKRGKSTRRFTYLQQNFMGTIKEGEFIFLSHPFILIQLWMRMVFPDQRYAPGDYVILAGPTPEEAISIKIDDEAEVFKVPEGEVIDIGEKTLSY